MLKRLIGEDIELRTVLDRETGSVKADTSRLPKSHQPAETLMKSGPPEIPPTAVGGFFIPCLHVKEASASSNGSGTDPLSMRELNDPPTAVGGIRVVRLS